MIGKPRRCDLVWFGSCSHLSVQRENRFLRFRRQCCVVRPVFCDFSKERTSTVRRNVGKYSPNDTASDCGRLYCSSPLLWCHRPRILSSAFVSVEWEYLVIRGRKWKWQGVEKSAGEAVVPCVHFTERCDGDEHFKGADRPEL